MEKYDSDSIFMRIALDYAWHFQTLTLPNPCVGTVVVCENTIIALQAHKKAGMPHAEVLACKEAFLYKIQNDNIAKREILKCCKQKNIKHKEPLIYLENKLKDMQDSTEIHDFITTYHSGIFQDCEFFVTLEPCNHYGKTPPCSALLNTIKPKRIVIAHEDNTPNAKGGAKSLIGIEIKNRVLYDESHKLIFPFLKWQQNNGFMLFKIAHRLNGDYKNGFISNDCSRVFTHNMRCVADYIVISGATLREDNPRLDNRFASPFYKSQKMPKILVISKTMKQKDLKNYNISCRDVTIIGSVKEIPKSGFKVIEGGFKFLQTLLYDMDLHDCAKIDCIMGYIAPAFNTSSQVIHELAYSKSKTNYMLAHTEILKDFWIKQINKKNKDKIDNMLYYLFCDN